MSKKFLKTRGLKRALVPTRKGEASALTKRSSAVSIGFGVLEALLSTEDHAIYVKLFFAPPFLRNT